MNRVEVVCPNCGDVLLEGGQVGFQLAEGSIDPLVTIHPVIHRISDKLDLPRIVQVDAQKLFSQQYKLNNRRARVTVGAVACIYLSCRNHGVVRTLREVSTAARVPMQDASRVCRDIITNSSDQLFPQIGIRALVSKFCNLLAFSERTKQRSMSLPMIELSFLSLRSRSPITVAAAVVYLVGIVEGEEISLHRVQSVTGISGETISEAFQEIKQSIVLESLLHSTW